MHFNDIAKKALQKYITEDPYEHPYLVKLLEDRKTLLEKWDEECERLDTVSEEERKEAEEARSDVLIVKSLVKLGAHPHLDVETVWNKYADKVFKQGFWGECVWGGSGQYYSPLKALAKPTSPGMNMFHPPSLVMKQTNKNPQWDIIQSQTVVNKELDEFFKNMRRNIKLSRRTDAMFQRQKKDEPNFYPKTNLHPKVEVLLKKMMVDVMTDIDADRGNPVKE